MAAALKTPYSLDELETKYHVIGSLYDLADELLATVESPFVKDKAAQMDLVEPLIAELGDATDLLAEEFIGFADAQRGMGKPINKSRAENALRKVFAALHDYQERVKSTSKKAGAALRNIADPIVKKIERAVDEIVVIFLDFVQLSLAAIMHKQQLEAVRARDPRIALMMHQHTMSQQ